MRGGRAEIHDPQLKMLPGTFEHIVRSGLQPAEGALEADLRDASCGPPPPPGCGPHGPDGPSPNRGKPAAERPGLRLGGAALRQTAAGCCAHSGTNLSFNRFAGDTDFGPRLAKRLHERTQRRTRVAGLRGAKLRPAGRCATELTNNHNSHNRRQCIASIRAQIQNYIRAGACEGHARADLRTRVAGLREGEAPARGAIAGAIQDSKLKIQN